MCPFVIYHTVREMDNTFLHNELEAKILVKTAIRNYIRYRGIKCSCVHGKTARDTSCIVLLFHLLLCLVCMIQGEQLISYLLFFCLWKDFPSYLNCLK